MEIQTIKGQEGLELEPNQLSFEIMREGLDLEDLIPKVESELEKALEERENLDLSIPQNYQVYLTYYHDERTTATARLTKEGPVICINAIPTAMHMLQDEDRNKLGKILHYFDITRTLLDQESWVLSAVQDPVEAIKRFEQLLGSTQRLQPYKDSFKTRGTTYEEYREFTIKNAESVKKMLEELMPKIREGFKKSDLALRHEMDHADFYSSQIYLDYSAKYQHAKELQSRLHFQGDKSISQELAKANMEVLKTTTEMNPILEIRAHFFNHIKQGEWDKADFEEVKNKIYGDFLRGYIEHAYSEEILDPLVSQKWSTGEMDMPTSIFLFYTVNKQRQSTNAAAYVIQPEKINYELAAKILYEEIPEWKKKLAENTQTAVEVIGNAYRDSPSRLKEANKAKNFQEYIEICKGGK